jgi:hypothetical protein
MPDEIINIGASVRARLQNLSRQTGQTVTARRLPCLFSGCLNRPGTATR